MFDTKVGVAKLSVVSNSLLIAVKLVAGILTGSISVIAEALHSLTDLAAAVIAFFSVKVAGHPADREHPFGHGKAESISGFVEAGLIFAAAALILYRAIDRLMTGVVIRETTLGIAVMAVSVVVNAIVSRRLLKVSRATDSLAIEADAAHLYTDVFTSFGVMVGLIAVELTGLAIIDSVAAIAVALLILKTAWVITKKAISGLMDSRLPADEESAIKAAIEEHGREVVGFHELRTRKVGSQRDIDLHLVMARNASLEEAHKMCDHLEQDICSRLKDVTINIHVEPCATAECAECAAICSLHDAERAKPLPGTPQPPRSYEKGDPGGARGKRNLPRGK